MWNYWNEIDEPKIVYCMIDFYNIRTINTIHILNCLTGVKYFPIDGHVIECEIQITQAVYCKNNKLLFTIYEIK